LALLADAGFWKRLWIGRHLRSCGDCRREVERFRACRESMAVLGDALPAGVDWDSLAPVMRANIHVGLAASECIANVGVRGNAVRGTEPAGLAGQFVRPGARLAWAACATAAFVVGGWFVYSRSIPGQTRPAAPVVAMAPSSQETILRASVGALGMERDGRALVLTYSGASRGSSVTVAANAVNASYIDDETGQVTIHHVYAE
jgi:hypothetical protein